MGGIELKPDALRAIEKTGEQVSAVVRAVVKTVIAICLAPVTPGFPGEAWDIAEAILNHAENGSDAADENSDDYPKQHKKLTKKDIKDLKKKGEDPEELKGGKRTGGVDLYKDKKGNIIVKPKGGIGPEEPTGLNINDFR